MEIDYIIVGLGLAGLSFAEELKKHNKSFVFFENESQTSSKVAAGMFNPVVLKRFTPVWNGDEQLKRTIPFFTKLENEFSKKYIFPLSILRIFKTIEEQNNWFLACDKPILSKYMIDKIIKNPYDAVNAPLGFGELKKTGRVDLKTLLEDYYIKLKEYGLVIQETFNYKELQIRTELVIYKTITAKKIIFCEGFGLKENPFFNYLPLNEAKGELITIHSPLLKVDKFLKAAVFIMPLGNDLYKIGATFNWNDKTLKPTLEGKNELIKKLLTVINSPFTVVDHIAGIRPTVKDRRPLIGVHYKYKNLAILNGLGTRGVMLAPTMAKKLYNHIECSIPLDSEIDIKRYYNLIKN